MRSVLLSTLVATLAIGAPCPAQTGGDQVFAIEDDGQWQKTDNVHRLAEFPKVNPDGRIWFRFEAPRTADSVSLDLGGDRYAMRKDAEGRWNVVIPGANPGFQIYAFVVDGTRIRDPNSTPYYVNGYVSVLEVPSPGEDFYDIKHVPHGDVREHWFYSDVEQRFRRSFVYTPPGYEKELDRRYPVLYLQHGAGEMEDEWTHGGRANFIVDNLLAEGRAEPMIIVMNNDFVYRPGDVPGRMALAPDWAGNFGDMLINEVIPDIDATYRTIADREHRAMAGLSLGGMLTNRVGMENLDHFAWIGIFSGGVVGDPATAHGGVMADAEAFNERVHLVFQSSGSEEGPERVLDNQAQLEAAGITNSVAYVSPGTAHDWMTWRRSLYQFAPLLFTHMRRAP